MDILDHLTQEHRQVESLLSKLEPTDPGPERNRLVDELSGALEKHMAVEEGFLYPIVEDVAGAETETEAEIEHGLTREGLAKLHELRAKPGFGAALDMVKAGIGHHVQEEEHEVFPKLRAKAADRLAGLDPEQLEARVEAGELELTRDELYEKARDADVPGRSSMTKDELAEAVAEAGS